MILLVFVVLGLAVGLLSGGRFSNIRAHNIHALWLPIAAFLVKGLAPTIVVALHLPLLPTQLVVCVLQYGALGAFAIVNWQFIVWPAVFGAGTLMNFLVIVANGGAMPVSYRVAALAPDTAIHIAFGEVFGYTLQTAATRLAFLGDIIFVHIGTWNLGFASIGDIFIGLGGCLLCVQLLRPAKQAANQKDGEEPAKPVQEGAQAVVDMPGNGKNL